MVALTALSIAVGGCVSGAQQLKPTLRVGIVNLDRILPELPKYRHFSDQYLQERESLLKDMGKDPAQMQKFLGDERKKLEIEQSIQKWDNTRRRFLGEVSDVVRTAAERVAQEKRLDIVLVNAPWFPVSQRMAVDITTDVIYALRETGKTVH